MRSAKVGRRMAWRVKRFIIMQLNDIELSELDSQHSIERARARAIYKIIIFYRVRGTNI